MEEISNVITILFLVLAFMTLFLFIGWFMNKKVKEALSPYTKMPLWKAERLPYETKRLVSIYLQGYREYDNRPFMFNKAVFCRETGRIFPNSINWRGKIVLDWSFLKKQCPGNWISWGSLSGHMQDDIRARHIDLDDFQTERSSSISVPSKVESDFAYTKPGPLYVDCETGAVMGWKVVPGSIVEVLIVQRPYDPTRDISIKETRGNK